MRAHNIGFYKPSHWHVWCQVICFCWCGSSPLDVHLKLSIVPLKTKQKKAVKCCEEQGFFSVGQYGHKICTQVSITNNSIYIQGVTANVATSNPKPNPNVT